MLMKALSIKQPWVYAILRKGKDIENRSWRRHYRGWIAIHASASPRHGARVPSGIEVPDLTSLDYSAICGIAKLTDIVTTSTSKWFQRPGKDFVNNGWKFTQVTRLPTPIRCEGSLGLWVVPHNLRRRIKRQLPHIDFRN